MQLNPLSLSRWTTLRAGAQHSVLGVIVILALVLRLSGNLYDLPYRFHPDERHYLDGAARMMNEGTLNPAYFQNPPLYSYAILLALYSLFGLQYLVGAVKTPAEFITTLSPAVAFGLARGLTAVAGTLTCLLLYRLGRRVGGELAGLLAALFYAVAFLSVRDAHFGVNDIPMVCLVTLAGLFALRHLEGGRPWDLVFGGLTAGLAAATKYNGGVALLPLLLACVLEGPGRGRFGFSRAREIGGKWLRLLLLALAGFLLGNPYAVLDHDAFLSGFASQYALRGRVWRGASSAPLLPQALESLIVEFGWPLFLLFLLAAAVCLARGGVRAKAAGLALSVVLPLLLYHASQALFFARFLLPCSPFIALISAWGIVAAREASPGLWARRPIVLWAGVVVLVASPLARSIYLDVILHRPDTRVLAREYLDRVAQPGSAIVLTMPPYYYIPPLDPKRYRILTIWSDPSLLHPVGATADFYLFSSFDAGRVRLSEAEERGLMAALERQGFARITFSPLRDGGDLPFEIDQIYLPYRQLFRYERPGPTIVLYARPGVALPTPPGSLQK
jgi:4-amino-4-deoxy-L-arabinose transferase-like glycosyltransferase